MNRFGKILRQGIGVAALAAIMTGVAGAAPAARAAGSTIVVATSTTPGNCGKYTTATTDLATAINTTTSGTILICPGIYGPLTADLVVPAGAKLTIKQAVTGEDSRPMIRPKATTAKGIFASGAASLALNGLTFDLTGLSGLHSGISLEATPASITNVTLIGGSNTAYGVLCDANTPGSGKTVTITGSAVLSALYTGVVVDGSDKLVMSHTYIDMSDGGRTIPYSQSIGVILSSGTPPKVSSGSITGNTILNATTGVQIQTASGVTIANNMIAINTAASLYGIELSPAQPLGTNNIKITGNTITGAGAGIELLNPAGNGTEILKASITKNVIHTSYAFTGSAPLGIEVNNDISYPPGKVTATISGNTFYGFPVSPSPLYVVNENANATLTVSGNAHIP